MLGEDAVDAVDGRVRHELLEFRGLEQEVADVDVEDDVVGAHKVALQILIVPVLADRVGERPGVAALALRVGHVLPLGLLNVLVHAHVDEGLLVEEGLVNLAHHLLRDRLQAETGYWLDQLGALRQITRLLQLPQVLLVLALVLRV